MRTEQRRPAEVFPPGEFIRDELEARGWTQIELAEILGRSLTLVNEIMSGKRGITPGTAKGLAAAFGTSAEFWLNLDAAYQLWRTPDEDSAVAKRARLYAKVPVREMVKRNWIEGSDNVDVLEKRVLDFFEIENLEEEPTFLAYAARKSSSYETKTWAQVAWLLRAGRVALAVPVTGTFARDSLEKAIERLRTLLPSPEETRHVPRVLGEAGVRFLVVEALPQTRIDGACFWLDSKSPVVVLSLRFDRIDNFWHTLMHELYHVKSGHGIVIDVDLFDKESPPEDEKPAPEREADRFAAQTLVPQDALENFIIRTRPLYSKLKIRAFAALMKVHAGIIVGQLQHRREIEYSHDREMLARVRHIITQAALTDGWGSVLPVAL